MAERALVFNFLGRDVSASRTAERVADNFDKTKVDIDKTVDHIRTKLKPGLEEDGRKLQTSLLKGMFTPDPEMAEAFARPFSRALSTPVGGVLAASLTPVLVAGISAAVMTGVAAATGAGLIGLAAFALKGSNTIKRSFADAGESIKTSLAKAAAPLENEFALAATKVAAAIARWVGPVNRIMATLRPGIQPLVDGLILLVERALPGIQSAMPTIARLFERVGANLPAVGDAIGRFFSVIEVNEPTLMALVDGLFRLATVAVDVVGGAVSWLTFKINELIGGWNNLAAAARVLNPELGKHVPLIAQAGAQTEKTTGFVKLAGDAMTDYSATVKAATDAQAQLAEQVNGMIPIFEGYRTQSGITKDTILEHLAQERDAFRTYSADVRTLLRRGLDPAIVQELAAKGPPYVHAFATASDKELAALERIFRSRTRAAGDAATAMAAAKGAGAGAAAARAMERSFHPVLIPPRVGAPAPKGRSRRMFAMAQGGVLTEPVLGVGLLSGAQYTLAEQGPEAVTPLGGPGRRLAAAGFGGGFGGAAVINLYLTVSGAIGDPQAVGRALAEPVRRELLRTFDRTGDLGFTGQP